MTHKNGAIISGIKRNSLAYQAGLQRGDMLLSIDGERPRDYIEYRYLAAVESLSLRLRRPNSGNFSVHIEKEPDEDLGIRFKFDVFDKVRTCRCCCEFCFVAQLPKGLRPTLYVKDDDYRLSFLHGNFITLSNLREADFERIFAQHLSPLWVSVHATDPEVRAQMMGCDALPDIVEQMTRLAEGGIEMHAQIVVCPGLNDGAVLEQTISDLAGLHPQVKSVGIVPVGIIRPARPQNLLYAVTISLARRIVERTQGWQEEFRKRFKTRFVWASDEMYLTAGLEPPPASEYEEFYQTGNGIGEVRRFIDELESADFPEILQPAIQEIIGEPPRILLATGAQASGLVGRLAQRLNEAGLEARVVAAANRLLGSKVTSASLIGGADWLEAIGLFPPADLVILPRQALNSEERFLDDMSRREFSRRLNVPVRFARAPLEAARATARFLSDVALGKAHERSEDG